jgi:hypothetical protein
MLSRLIVLILMGFGLGACSSGSDDSSGPAGGETAQWQTLFDGSNLVGWTQVGDANWQLVDGAVQADSGSGSF